MHDIPNLLAFNRWRSVRDKVRRNLRRVFATINEVIAGQLAEFHVDKHVLRDISNIHDRYNMPMSSIVVQAKNCLYLVVDDFCIDAREVNQLSRIELLALVSLKRNRQCFTGRNAVYLSLTQWLIGKDSLYALPHILHARLVRDPPANCHRLSQTIDVLDVPSRMPRDEKWSSEEICSGRLVDISISWRNKVECGLRKAEGNLRAFYRQGKITVTWPVSFATHKICRKHYTTSILYNHHLIHLL